MMITSDLAIWKKKIERRGGNVTFDYSVFPAIVMRVTRLLHEADYCIRSWWVSHSGYIIILVATAVIVAVR